MELPLSHTLWKYRYPQSKTRWNFRILSFNTPLEIPLSLTGGIQKFMENSIARYSEVMQKDLKSDSLPSRTRSGITRRVTQ